MNGNVTAKLLILFITLSSNATAQVDVSGFWLGITYPSDPNLAIYNYTTTFTQKGATLGGTSKTSDPNLPFGGLAYLTGQVNASQLTVREADQNGSTAVKGVCFWDLKLTYNPADESLIGTYENINNSICTTTGGGKVELYRIVLKSGSQYCKGTPVDLVVTGKNIKWYASSTLTNPIAKGNTFSPKITKTTTFYITQTLYQNESPAVPITVEIVEPTVEVTILNTGCDKANGSLAVTATGASDWQYSLNGGNFQKDALFTSLKPGSYTVVAKAANGCQGEKSATITNDTGPTITQLLSKPPRCAADNGEVTVVATGGKPPLTYSINYGGTYQNSPLFTKLVGGSYTLRTRDANGCETNSAVSLPSFVPMVVSGTTTVPTSCGQANGQVSLSTQGGSRPVQYSIDSQNFQTSGVFAGLRAGTYTMLARDSAGCTVSQSMSIAASTGPQTVDVRTTGEGCGLKNGAVLISTTRAAGLDDYSIDGQTFQRITSFSGLTGGTYTLTVRDDKNCTATQTVRVTLDCANQIQLPTAFSPNADQQNDALTARFAFGSLKVLRFIVYDRWGTVLFSRADFDVRSGEPLWDGQINGQAAPPGTYTCRLDCQFPDGTQTTYRQPVAVLSEK